MELRHLRYFVAVAETGSLTEAAARRLNTSQPSLSRQIRDLEREVGVELLSRGARGVEVTAAGRAFLDHARLALTQVDAAGDAARRAALPAKQSFALGFLTGQEVDWLPEAMRILHDELPSLEVTVCSEYSPDLAAALMRGKLDVAFLRAEANVVGLTFKTVAREPLVVIMPSDHHLASRKAVRVREIAGETFISISKTAPVLRAVIDAYLARSGVDITPKHAADNLAMGISLVASTRGVGLLPAYARNFLPSSVVSRPLAGDVPTIDLVIGYSNANSSPTLKRFLARVDELVTRVSQRVR